MPWTAVTRKQHDRSDLRYASDLRDGQGNESRLTRIKAERGQEIGVIPFGELAFSLDRVFSGHGADEIEGQMAHQSHVLGAVAASQARLVLFEDDIEHPVQAVFDSPVRPCGVGEGLCGQLAR